MPDYEKMYHILCKAASAALDRLPDMMKNREGRNILEMALLEAEELYVETSDDQDQTEA